jgi:hypothetical protein
MHGRHARVCACTHMQGGKAANQMAAMMGGGWGGGAPLGQEGVVFATRPVRKEKTLPAWCVCVFVCALRYVCVHACVWVCPGGAVFATQTVRKEKMLPAWCVCVFVCALRCVCVCMRVFGCVVVVLCLPHRL